MFSPCSGAGRRKEAACEVRAAASGRKEGRKEGRENSRSALKPESLVVTQSSPVVLSEAIRVARLLARRSLSAFDSDDVAQQVVVELWQSAAGGHGVRSASALASVIAKRRVKDWLRSAGRCPLLFHPAVEAFAIDDTPAPCRAETLPAEEGNDTGDGVRHAMPNVLRMFLGRNQRAALAIVLDGGSAADVATQLRIPAKEAYRLLRIMTQRCQARNATALLPPPGTILVEESHRTP